MGSRGYLTWLLLRHLTLRRYRVFSGEFCEFCWCATKFVLAFAKHGNRAAKKKETQHNHR